MGSERGVAGSVIHCEKLTKHFGSHQAVNDVSFSVGRGEICAVLGPNGAGKSTLIRLLTGLLRPDAGTATIAGWNVSARSLQLRRLIGVVPENLALPPELTIEEHLQLTGPIYGIDDAETRVRSGQILQLLDLADKGKTLAREGSHGMRKKTALAMALLHNPSVLILDEPFEGIDPASSESIRVLLKTISERGITVLFTSHILPLVDRLATHLILIRAGEVVHDSPASHLTRTAEQLYFELVEAPAVIDLEWLHSRPL
ncbi:MAG: ABC transporter ATP-binding protein [Bryobacteraceae bacterium]|nr:ABC transporter ATP-binding protein [Bryobacteraceae bacterium]